nr:D-hexose-6-phosphate mutarotase [Thiorhodococcus mannitoliphagus]
MRFVEGRSGFLMIEVENALATATITPFGGQVLHYRPREAPDDLLFLSDQAHFTAGKENKGGIPICWPWFGPDPEGQGRATHGFIRCLPWTLHVCEELEDGSTRIHLGITDDEATRAIWPLPFELGVEILVGSTLAVTLVSRNRGDHPMRITQGLHSYFKVGDATRIRVLGLEGCRYIDKARGAGDARIVQDGAITVGAEVNRIYEAVPARLAIEDPVLGRRIGIDTRHSRTCVVWNPWIETCREMEDLGDEDYRRFICVETVNTASEVIEIPPGQEARIGADYRVESL